MTIYDSSTTTAGSITFSGDLGTNVSLGDNVFTFTTPAYTTLSLKGKGDIGPRLYFSYVKSKLNKTDVDKLKIRLNKLSKLIPQVKISGQIAAYEELCKMLVVAVREQEAAVMGANIFIKNSDITKFIDRVKGKCIKFDPLENFPRPIPKKSLEIIKKFKDANVFDNYWILYIDYTNEKLKTNKEKIREKDPIVFGSFSYASNTFYYITDWIDKYCDLTLNKFVDTMKNVDDFVLNTVDENIDVTQIQKEVMDRYNRLKDAQSTNFRALMIDEDKSYQSESKLSFLTRIKKWLY